MIASIKPRSNITMASRMYMIPIRLWSTLVIHSCQRYGSQPFSVIQARTPMITTPTKAAATSGIGWSNGMAAQLSLPNILMLHPLGDVVDRDELGGSYVMSHCKQGRIARVGQKGLRARSGRQLLRDDLVEQFRLDRTEGERTYVHALLGQGSVASGIESWGGVARDTNPSGKPFRRHRLHIEMHVRETIATIMARKTEIRAWCVRAQVQLRHHAVHRVDHAAELRDEERIHHARRRKREMDGHAGGNHKLVHASDMLVRVDEEPLPIQRNG